MTQVYVSIGNSDDKLTQKEWAEFCDDLVGVLDDFAERIYGQWYSLPNAPYQNMVASIEVVDDLLDTLRHDLAPLAAEYRQDEIALMPGVTEFITAPVGDRRDDPVAVDVQLDHIAGHALTGLAHDQNGGAA